MILHCMEEKSWDKVKNKKSIGKKDLRKYIFDYVNKKYSSEPEYLWLKYPGYAVLRNKDNSKWYAVIMNVERNRLKVGGTDMVDVLDVKCDKALIGSLLGRKGYIPAYHMNKSNWISVLLDGSVSKKDITYLIDLSYELTAGK